MQLNENRVREYAYKIWEAEGKPDGLAEQHWAIACKTLAAEQERDSDAVHYTHDDESETHGFIPHQNKKKGKHAHHPDQPH